MNDPAVATILESAARARRKLRTTQLKIELRWLVGKVTTSREFALTFERPSRLRLIEKENRSSLVLSHDLHCYRKPGLDAFLPRESFHTISYCLKESGFFFPTLGEALEGKPITLPKSVAKLRKLPGECIGWTDSGDGAEHELTFDDATGLPVLHRARYRTRAGTVFAEFTETCEILPPKPIPPGFFVAALPELPQTSLKLLKTLPPQVALRPEVQKLLEAAVAAGKAVRSLSGVRFSSFGLELEEFALEAPGKLLRRDHRGERRVIYRSDGRRYEYPVDTFSAPRPLDGTRPAKEYLDTWLVAPIQGILSNSIWRPTAPGRLAGTRIIGNTLCDVVELEGVFPYAKTGFYGFQRIDIGHADRLVRQITHTTESSEHFMALSFPELTINPRMPVSLFALSKS